MKNFTIFFTFFFLTIGFSLSALAQCSASETNVGITIQPDNWGSEITWSLTGVSGSPTYDSGGPYTNMNTNLITADVCVPTDSELTFTINDSYGDGICCAEGEGYYILEVEGITLSTGGAYGSGESVSFFAPPLALDLALTAIHTFDYVFQSEQLIKGSVKNLGSSIVTSFDLTYSTPGSGIVTQNVTGVSIEPFTSYEFTHETPWFPTDLGMQTMIVWIANVNGEAVDNNPDNDMLTKEIEIGKPIPNIIDSYLIGIHEFIPIGTTSDQVNRPRDLDFHPTLSRKELWIVNEDTENTGGSTVTFYNAGEGNQTSEWRRDGNAWHFMSLPTSIAFGENSNFATGPGVLDANHSGGTFTGPSLWSSDPAIYANIGTPPSAGVNGSHLDMLHGSPFGMGIAHEVDNVYWLYDGHNDDIVRYDFGLPHEPGGDNHADGKVQRYSDLGIDRDGTTPSHLVLDKKTNWLYIVDNGNDRVLRMDISTSQFSGNLPLLNEPLAEHSTMSAAWEPYITTGLEKPCGIEIIDNRLLVTDNATGDIIIYGTEFGVTPPPELGRIETQPGIMGIKVGPEGRIWYVNRNMNQVMKIEPENAEPVGIENPTLASKINIYPNPTAGTIHINVSGFDATAKVQANIRNIMGQTVEQADLTVNSNNTITFDNLANGIYLVTITAADKHFTQRIVLNR